MHKYIPKFFAITDTYDESLFKHNTSNFGIIYRNYKLNKSCIELNKIALNCRKRGIAFFVSNNTRLAIKYKATGIYIPSFNRSGVKHILFAKKNLLVLGSAHNIKEINEKINQGCDAIFLSPIFQTKNYKKVLGIYKFNTLTKNKKIKFYALGGLNNSNLKKLKVLNAVGFGAINLYKKNRPKLMGRF